jgi:hypothetical protein
VVWAKDPFKVGQQLPEQAQRLASTTALVLAAGFVPGSDESGLWLRR